MSVNSVSAKSRHVRIDAIGSAVLQLAFLLAMFVSAASPAPATPASGPASRDAYRKFALITPGDAEAGRRLFNNAS